MLWLRRLALKAAIRRVLANRCPDSFSIGEKTTNINCFWFYFLEDDGDPFALVKGYSHKGYSALFWSGDKFEHPGMLFETSMDSLRIRIRRFFHDEEIVYTDLFSFWLYEIILLPRILHLANTIKERIFKLSTPHRSSAIEILQLLVEIRCKNAGRKNFSMNSPPSYTALDILIYIHGPLVVLHPKYDELCAYTEMTLESLRLSREIDQGNFREYFATGKALDTLRRYEEENRRHRDILWSNRIMAVLTAALVVLTFFQVYIAWFPQR